MGPSSCQDNHQKITMGYPSIDRYMYPPPPPPPPPLYDNKSNELYYPQAQAQAQAQAQVQAQAQQLEHRTNSNSLSFRGVMLALMFCLVASMCLMTLLMWFLFGAYTPDFSVTSLRVSNFSISDTNLTADCFVSMKVSNANKDLALQFDPVISSLLYKESLVGVSAVKPFDVPRMNSADLDFSIPTEQRAGGEGVGELEDRIKPELKEDFDSGVVVFCLRLAMMMNFTTPNTVYRHVNMRVLCENMHVKFAPGTGEGTLLPGDGNTCLMRINERLKED